MRTSSVTTLPREKLKRSLYFLTYPRVYVFTQFNAISRDHELMCSTQFRSPKCLIIVPIYFILFTLTDEIALERL
jgi:hypothetical protein